MPQAKNPALLATVYNATKALLATREVPTRPVQRFHTVFHSIDIEHLTKPASGKFLTRIEESNALWTRYQFVDKHRWSGPSLNAAVPSSGGLYCVLQQQALVNEAMHYHRGEKGPVTKYDPASLADKAIARYYLKNSILAMDLSNSNPATQNFYAKLLPQLAQNRLQIHRMLSDHDCSIPRGIGLAVAQCSYLQALIVPTMRFSDRSFDERGDNIVFFGPNNQPVYQLVLQDITFP